MIDAADMSTPVTRGELRAELQELEVRLEQRLEQKLEQKLDQKLDQKLEIWGGALLARIESGEQRLAERIEGLERRLLAEFARHTRASHEDMSRQLSAIDDKYADLPPRVGRLEDRVLARRRRQPR